MTPLGIEPAMEIQYLGSIPASLQYNTKFIYNIKTLKNAPTCFDLIQIIFGKLVCSLLKLLILKFVKNVKVNVVMRQHNIWCVYVLSV